MRNISPCDSLVDSRIRLLRNHSSTGCRPLQRCHRLLRCALQQSPNLPPTKALPGLAFPLLHVHTQRLRPSHLQLCPPTSSGHTA